MTLIQSWKQVITLIEPPTARIFFLSSCKRMLTTARTLYLWWWLLVPIIIVDVVIVKYMEVSYVLSAFLLAVVMLAVRSSLPRKREKYIIVHAVHLIIGTGAVMLIQWSTQLVWGFMSARLAHTIVPVMNWVFLLLLVPFSSLFCALCPITAAFLLCYYDVRSPRIIPAITRTCAWCIKTYPLQLLCYGALIIGTGLVLVLLSGILAFIEKLFVSPVNVWNVYAIYTYISTIVYQLFLYIVFGSLFANIYTMKGRIMLLRQQE